jgi:hypothetical protein
MLALEDIEDALITDAKANITGLQTCVTHEKDIDEQTLQALLPKAPFSLIRYGGTEPIEDQRMADGGAGMKKREFYLAIGAASLRSKKEGQRGAYDLLDDFRDRYDGLTLPVGSGFVTFAYGGDRLVLSIYGLVVYIMILSWTED